MFDAIVIVIAFVLFATVVILRGREGTLLAAAYGRGVAALRAGWRTVDVGIVVLFMAVAATAERLMGRALTCTCGTIKLWWGNVWSSENSQQFFDPYSFTHIAHGILMYHLLAWIAPKRSAAWRILCVLAVEAAWEIVENSSFIIDRYRAATFSLDYYGDTIFNSFGDIVSCLIGVLLAVLLPRKVSLSVFIAIELLLAFWIRDNLTLNVVMLLAPISAVKHWQLNGH